MSEPKPTITLSGSRGEEWERVLGTRTFAIVSAYGEVCNLDGLGPTACAMLDVDALTREQQDALIDHLAEMSGMLRASVKRNVYTMGVPIRLGVDARIDVPAGYESRRRLLNGPDAFDLRFFT